MATENLGKVSLTMGGSYSPTASYARLTVVRGSNGNSYVSKTSVAGVEPGVDPGWEDYWQIFALDGEPGVPGAHSISWEQTVTTGTKIAEITIDGTETDVYAPEGGGGGVVSIITNPATTLTLQPCPVTYKWGEVAELTLTVTANTEYHFMFTCPSSAATILTITGITGKTGDTTLEAGKTYEVDVWAGIALYQKIEAEAVT